VSALARPPSRKSRSSLVSSAETHQRTGSAARGPRLRTVPGVLVEQAAGLLA